MVFKRKKFLSQISLLNVNYRAFSMVEAVVGIFLIGILGITFFSVMSSALRAQFSSRDKIIATNLAQEGIELVRNLRDNNWKRGRTAFDTSNPSGFPAYSTAGISCGAYCGSSVSDYTTIMGTKFTRNITIYEKNDASLGFRILVSSKVTTVSGTSVTIEDILYPWAG